MSLTQCPLSRDPDLGAKESGTPLWQADSCPAPGPPCQAACCQQRHGAREELASSLRPAALLTPASGRPCHFPPAKDSSVSSGGAGVGPMGRAPQPSPPFTPPQRGSKTTAQPTPADPLLWTPGALPGPPQGSQSKNLLAFFVPNFEYPSAPQRGLEPLLLFLAPHLPALGAEDEEAVPSLPLLRLASLLWGPASARTARVVLE